jgi:hypothetical protein
MTEEAKSTFRAAEAAADLSRAKPRRKPPRLSGPAAGKSFELPAKGGQVSGAGRSGNEALEVIPVADS